MFGKKALMDNLSRDLDRAAHWRRDRGDQKATQRYFGHRGARAAEKNDRLLLLPAWLRRNKEAGKKESAEDRLSTAA